jgi:hypothetical protein
MTAPTITFTSTTRIKVSLQDGANTATVRFMTDQDLIAWEARADGYSAGTGTLVGSQTGDSGNTIAFWHGASDYHWTGSGDFYYSGAEVLAKGATASFKIAASLLSSGDKAYRITIYGRNRAGEWSKYG